MNPLKFKQAMDYLTRIKKVKPDLPEVFPASQAPVPPKKESLETMEAINRFVRDNPRQDMAGGGMLVQPGFGGTRQGYAEAKFDDPSANIKVGDELGKGISQSRLKKDGSVSYYVTKGKLKGKTIGQTASSYEDAVAEREKFVPRKKGIPINKKQLQNENKWRNANPELDFDSLTPTMKSDIRRTGRTDIGTIGRGQAQLKGKDSPFYKPLDAEGKKLAKKLYGTTDVSDDIRKDIMSGKITEDTKPVQFKKGKDISLKMKKGSEVVTGVEFPEKTIDADGNIETAKEMEERFKKFVKKRVEFPERGLTGTGYANENIADEFPISQRQGRRLANYYIKKLGLKYAKSKFRPEVARTQKSLTKTSLPREERRITKLKTAILKQRDLSKKVDKAHRVSKAHMEKLGLQFDTSLLGVDSRIINQVIVKPSEIKLNNLYAKQRKVLDLLKENPDSIELKNKMTEINKGVKQIVKDTSGRLIGVTVDLDTLEPTFEGIKKKNTFTKFLGNNYKMTDLGQVSNEALSKAIAKAVDAEVKRGFVPNDFKNILTNKESQRAILKYAKKRAPDAIKDLKFAFKNPFSKKAMQVLSIPAIFYTGYKGAEAAKKEGIGFDKEFEQTAALGDAPVVEKGLSTGEKIAAGAGTTGTAIGAYKFRKPITRAAKAVAPKLLGPAGLAIEGAFAKQAFDEGRSVPEIIATPFALEGIVSDAQERLRMTRPERQAVNREQIVNDFSDLDTDFLTPIIPGSLDVDVDAVRQRAAAEELAARELRAQQRAGVQAQSIAGLDDPFYAAGGGIAKLAGIDKGPQRVSMNPDSQGLQGLMKRVKRI
jgi:hypothetical protein